jgi:hypothetical protein
MTRRDELLALAARVEAAQGADAELDASVARAAGWIALDARMWWRAEHVAECRRLKVSKWKYATVHLPTFTASLDGAASLVPKGWRVNTADWSIPGTFTWMLKGPCLKRVPNEDGGWDAGSDWYVSGRSLATPALALTAAALRALAEEAGDE